MKLPTHLSTAALCLFACAPAVVAPSETPTVPAKVETRSTADDFRNNEPVAGPEPALAVPRVRSKKLPNGLRLLVAKRTAPTVTVRLEVPGSSALSSPSSPMLANLMFATALGGGSNAHDAMAVSRLFEAHFAEWGVFGYADSAGVWMTVPTATDVKGAIALLAELTTDPRFAQGEIDPRVTGLVGSASRDASNPRTLASQVLVSALFGDGHPYAREHQGYDGPTHVDRSQLVTAHAELCDPTKATLILTGAVNDEIEAQAVESFGKWTAKPHAPAPAFVAPTLRPGPTLMIVDRPNARQVRVAAGWPAVGRASDDYFATYLMFEILAADTVGRFAQAITARHASWVAEPVYEALAAGGAISWDTNVDNAEVGDVLAMIDKETERLRSTDVPDAELSLAKTQAVRVAQPWFATSRDFAATLSLIPSCGLSENTWETYTSKLAAVTAGDIKRAAQSLARDRLRVALVGDWTAIRPMLAKRGPVELRDSKGVLLRVEP